jgi:hypothetical protein
MSVLNDIANNTDCNCDVLEHLITRREKGKRNSYTYKDKKYIAIRKGKEKGSKKYTIIQKGKGNKQSIVHRKRKNKKLNALKNYNAVATVPKSFVYPIKKNVETKNCNNKYKKNIYNINNHVNRRGLLEAIKLACYKRFGPYQTLFDNALENKPFQEPYQTLFDNALENKPFQEPYQTLFDNALENKPFQGPYQTFQEPYQTNEENEFSANFSHNKNVYDREDYVNCDAYKYIDFEKYVNHKDIYNHWMNWNGYWICDYDDEKNVQNWRWIICDDYKINGKTPQMSWTTFFKDVMISRYMYNKLELNDDFWDWYYDKLPKYDPKIIRPMFMGVSSLIAQFKPVLFSNYRNKMFKNKKSYYNIMFSDWICNNLELERAFYNSSHLKTVEFDTVIYYIMQYKM